MNSAMKVGADIKQSISHGYRDYVLKVEQWLQANEDVIDSWSWVFSNGEWDNVQVCDFSQVNCANVAVYGI